MTSLVQRTTVALTPWAAPVAAAAAAVVCCTVAGITDPTHPGSGLPGCPFKMVTGWGCPVCGSTRMLHMLVHGDIASAARYNAVTLAMTPVVVWLWIGWTQQRLGLRRLPTWQPSRRVMWVGLAGWIAFSILRNLPWAPFSALNV